MHRLCFAFGNSSALMQRGRLSSKGDFHLIRLLPEIETTEEDPIFWILSLLLCGFFVSCVQISTESKLYADKKNYFTMHSSRSGAYVSSEHVLVAYRI